MRSPAFKFASSHDFYHESVGEGRTKRRVPQNILLRPDQPRLNLGAASPNMLAEKDLDARHQAGRDGSLQFNVE
jgi:hypothetical protein